MRTLVVRIVSFLTVVLVAVSIGAAAAAGAEFTGGLDAYCQARVDLEKALSEAPFGNATPTQGEVAQFQERLFTLFGQLNDNAPSELAAQVSAVYDALIRSTQTGTDPFDDPAVQAAAQAINEHVIANCGFEVVEVTAREYTFEGMAKTVPAGIVAFRLTNAGAEVHELAVFRIKGDASISEILRMPEKKQPQQVRFLGGTLAAQGDSGATMLELKPGRYGVICSMAVGTTDPGAAPDPEAPTSHADEGQHQEFTVKKA